MKDSTFSFTPLILHGLRVQRVPAAHPVSLIPEACSSNVQADTCSLTCSDVGLVLPFRTFCYCSPFLHWHTINQAEVPSRGKRSTSNTNSLPAALGYIGKLIWQRAKRQPETHSQSCGRSIFALALAHH